MKQVCLNYGNEVKFYQLHIDSLIYFYFNIIELKELRTHWAKSSGAERETSKVEHKKKKKELKRVIEEEVPVVEPKKKKKKKHSL